MINIWIYISFIPGIIIACGLHEYVKAVVSTRLGDPVPKQKGRLTLNPFAHIDLLGAILILITGFGWAKPVQTSPIFYKNRKRDTLITYIMPSVCNLFIGVCFSLAYNLAYPYLENIIVSNAGVGMFIQNTIIGVALININMAFFNLIPVYPLDGAKILNMFVSAETAIKLQRTEHIFQMILVFLLLMGYIGMIINPFVNLILRF